MKKPAVILSLLLAAVGCSEKKPTVKFIVSPRQADGTYAVEQWVTRPHFGGVEVGRFRTRAGAKVYAAQLSDTLAPSSTLHAPR